MESPSASAAAWFSTDLEEMDDFNLILDCPLSLIMLEDINISADHGEELQQSISIENESSTSCPAMNTTENAHIPFTPVATNLQSDEFAGSEWPAKQVKENGRSSSRTNRNSSLIHHGPLSSKSQFLLSFENPNTSPTGSAKKNQIRDSMGNGTMGVVKPKQSWPMQFLSPSPKDSSDAEQYASKSNKAGSKRSHSATRSPSHTKDHIMAERLRREKLTQLFIALSALVPGLKKVDKASVLEDTIKYVKQLQERLKVLEEQIKKRTVESAVLVMKHNPSSVSGVDDDDTSSFEETSQTQSHARFTDDSLAEVEARICDQEVLIRVHCQRQMGVVSRILNALESFPLSILSSSVLPFGDLKFHINIIAKVESEFSVSVKDLVKSLQLAL